MAKTDIRSLSASAMSDMVKGLGLPSYRAAQIEEWLWTKGATSFGEMTNLSKDFRDKLDEAFEIRAIRIGEKQISKDGTVKVRFDLHDNEMVEGVLIPTDDRSTACISSQVGCSLSCAFCATGFLPRKRNLDPAEIYDQVRLLDEVSLEQTGRHLSNIVLMGMGEPLLNYHNVLAGVERITGTPGLGRASSRVTVSTAGIAKMIRKLGDDEVKFNLALSLHATTDEGRSEMMAINETNNLATLVEALNYFYAKTQGRITFEYILFDGLNESPDDARRLIALCRKVPARVNIIEYNPIDEADFKPSQRQRREEFIRILEAAGVTSTVRRSRGKDIDAACGQLANRKRQPA